MKPSIKKIYFWLGIFLVLVFFFFFFLSSLLNWQIEKMFSRQPNLNIPPKTAKDEPKEVFNLTAKIVVIEKNSLLVLDDKNETYKINIDKETVINPSFEELKIGDYITIEAKESIKGKKEFLASYINKI